MGKICITNVNATAAQSVYANIAQISLPLSPAIISDSLGFSCPSVTGWLWLKERLKGRLKAWLLAWLLANLGDVSD